MADMTNDLMSLAAKAVAANQALLAAIAALQPIIDEYNAVSAVQQYTDAMFTGSSLAYLTAFNIESLISNVFPAFQQVYTDTVNYTANGGRNKNLMNLCKG